MIAGPVLLIVAVGAVALRRREAPHEAAPSPYSGSARCRDCHQDFYRRWSGSHHGLAMQAFSTTLARAQLAPQAQDVVVGGHRFRADPAAGVVRETSADGAVDHPISHPISHVMG